MPWKTYKYTGRLTIVPEDMYVTAPEDLLTAPEHKLTAPKHLLTAPEQFSYGIWYLLWKTY